MRFRAGGLTVAFIALAASLFPASARADEAQVYGSVMQSAQTALQAALSAETQAQARPIGEKEKPLSTPGLPTGFTFQYDISMAKSLGNTGYRNGLPGGMDGLIAYGFSPHLRLEAAYYDFQEYPLGFDTGTVPLYLQGISAPIGTTNLADNPVDATTKNSIVVLQAQNLLRIGKLPLVISPTYFARSATIAGHSDSTQIEVNGFPQTVPLRSAQYYLLAVTVPFLSSPRFFGTLTAAPQWNVNLNGAQTTNHAQIFELAYLEFRASKHATLFFQPSRLIDNLGGNITPQYITAFIYGASYKLNKYAFVQFVASTGTPTNQSQLGITAVTLQQVPGNSPPPASATAPTIAGLKATQIQVMFGIGSPSVIPL